MLPGFAGVSALAVAIVGAILIRDDTGVDEVNRFVETLSGNSSSYFGDLGLPLGFAFGAGMAAAFNPCGFAMLPAYMGLFLGDRKSGEVVGGSQLRSLAKALLIGGTVTAGFVALFAVAGTIIGVGARSVLSDILPWLGLFIGLLLAIAGSWILGGGKLYTAFAAQAAARIGDPGQTTVRGYFLFGVSYGTASLSCTLPIFLSVVGTSFAVSSIGTSFGQFVMYALGMGVIIIALTLWMALFREAMVGGLRRALPYIEPVGAWLMILAGAYIVFYWLTIGDLLDKLS